MSRGRPSNLLGRSDWGFGVDETWGKAVTAIVATFAALTTAAAAMVTTNGTLERMYRNEQTLTFVALAFVAAASIVGVGFAAFKPGDAPPDKQYRAKCFGVASVLLILGLGFGATAQVFSATSRHSPTITGSIDVDKSRLDLALSASGLASDDIVTLDVEGYPRTQPAVPAGPGAATPRTRILYTQVAPDSNGDIARVFQPVVNLGSYLSFSAKVWLGSNPRRCQPYDSLPTALVSTTATDSTAPTDSSEASTSPSASDSGGPSPGSSRSGEGQQQLTVQGPGCLLLDVPEPARRPALQSHWTVVDGVRTLTIETEAAGLVPQAAVALSVTEQRGASLFQGVVGANAAGTATINAQVDVPNSVQGPICVATRVQTSPNVVCGGDNTSWASLTPPAIP